MKWFLGILIEKLIAFFYDLFRKWQEGQAKKKENEETNKEIKEEVENAETEEERQEALNKAARRTGRNP